MPSNASFDSRLSTTISRWMRNDFTDLITGNNPLFFLIRDTGNMIAGGGSGGQFVEPFMFVDGTGPAVVGITSATAYNALTLAETTQFTSASYTVTEKVMPISVQEYDITAQGSETTKINLVAKIMKRSIAVFNEALNADLWAAPEGANSAQARQTLASIRTLMNGAFVSTTALGGGTITEQANNAGVARATVAVSAQNAISTVGGVNRNLAGSASWCVPTIIGASPMSVFEMSRLISMTARGVDQANVVIMPRQMRDKFVSALVNGGTSGGQIYGPESSNLVKAGFKNAMQFNGCDIIFDDNCPTAGFLSGTATPTFNEAFAINTQYLNLNMVNTRPTIRETPDSRVIRLWTAVWYGGLSSGHLGRVHGKHAGLQ